MSERQITVLEEPSVYVGIPKGSDKLVLAFNSETDHEVRIYMAPLQFLALVQQGAVYAHQLLEQHVQVIERHERNIDPSAQVMERDRPAKLDA